MERPHHTVLRGQVDADEATAPVAHPRLALMVVCLAIFVSTIDTTIVNVALPEISADIGASTSQLQWIMAAYTVALAGLILLANGVADRFGRRLVFASGLALFTVTSLLAAFADSATGLIVSRAGMGVAAAMIFPPALSLIAVMFPPRERRRAIAVWSLVAGIGVALGPVVGGLLLDWFSWGSVFLVNVPVTLVGLAGALVLLPESRRPGSPRLDVAGGVLSVVALTGIVYAIIEGPETGWTDPEIVAAFGIGALALVAFVWWQRRIRDPLFDVGVLADRVVLAGFVTLFFFYVVFLGVEFVVPQYLQSVEGMSTVAVGLVMLTFGILEPPPSLLAPRLVERVGAGPLMVTSLAGLTVVGLLLATVGSGAGIVVVVVALALCGGLLGLGFTPTTSAVMNALPVAKAGDGSAVNQVARQVGAAFGVALIGSVLAAGYANAIDPALTTLTAADAETARQSIEGAASVASSLTGDAATSLTTAADAAFERGARVAMLTVAALAAVSALIVYLLLRGTSAMRPPPADDAGELGDDVPAGA